jgi:hypothetical protein
MLRDPRSSRAPGVAAQAATARARCRTPPRDRGERSAVTAGGTVLRPPAPRYNTRAVAPRTDGERSSSCPVAPSVDMIGAAKWRSEAMAALLGQRAAGGRSDAGPMGSRSPTSESAKGRRWCSCTAPPRGRARVAAPRRTWLTSPRLSPPSTAWAGRGGAGPGAAPVITNGPGPRSTAPRRPKRQRRRVPPYAILGGRRSRQSVETSSASGRVGASVG